MEYAVHDPIILKVMHRDRIPAFEYRTASSGKVLAELEAQLHHIALYTCPHLHGQVIPTQQPMVTEAGYGSYAYSAN